VTERPGRLRIIEADGTVQPPVNGLPTDIVAENQGGLLDVVLDPGHAINRRIYLTYAGGSAGQIGLVLTTAVLDAGANALQNVDTLYRQTPTSGSTGHFGGRIVLSADNQHLFITGGDRQHSGDAPQRTDSEIGKILRLRLNGDAPGDNPFAAEAGGQRIWSLGHRNIQGAARHPQTGALWVNEHGPQGGDEVNLIVRGANYGWPQVSYGCEYGSNPCTPIGGGTHAPAFVEPVTHWGVSSTAPSGMSFYSGTLIPQWQGKLLVGALAGRTLWLLDTDQPGPIICAGTDAQRQGCDVVDLVDDLGQRIRDVRQGPDGAVYLLTDADPGALLRLAPP